ncbi:MAG: DUF5683 domain-containing protein [Bacteroidota bacterium]
MQQQTGILFCPSKTIHHGKAQKKTLLGFVVFWIFLLFPVPLLAHFPFSLQPPDSVRVLKTDSMIPFYHDISIDSAGMEKNIPHEEKDTLPADQPRRKGKNRDYSEHLPLRATMLSATLPGLGQVYNNRIWKVPIVYAGFGAIIYFVDFNNTEYQNFRRAYVARVDGNPNTTDEFPFYSTDQLERAMNFYRRNLEITYIAGAALYLLQILDATVDAHLLDFDVGEDLSMNILPSFHLNSGFFSSLRSPVTSIKISFSF